MPITWPVSSCVLIAVVSKCVFTRLLVDTGLYGWALWKIAAKAKAGMEAGLKKDKHLEGNASATTGLVPIYE